MNKSELPELEFVFVKDQFEDFPSTVLAKFLITSSDKENFDKSFDLCERLIIPDMGFTSFNIYTGNYNNFKMSDVPEWFTKESTYNKIGPFDSKSKKVIRNCGYGNCNYALQYSGEYCYVVLDLRI